MIEDVTCKEEVKIRWSEALNFSYKLVEPCGKGNCLQKSSKLCDRLVRDLPTQKVI